MAVFKMEQWPLLVPVLLIPFVGVLYAREYSKCYARDGNSTIDDRFCFRMLLKGCASLTLDTAQGRILENLGCQEFSEEGLQCLRSKAGFTHSGNCIYFTGTGNTFVNAVHDCHAEYWKTGGNGVMLWQEEVGSVTLCNCNDGDVCNPNCTCHSSYSSCGVKPCELRPRPTTPPPPPTPGRDCYCKEQLPNTKHKHACVGGRRTCDDSSKGCHTTAQKKVYSIKDCVNDLPGLGCVMGKLKRASGPGTCVSASPSEWKQVINQCGWRQYEEHGDKEAIIKVCHCAGEFCNKDYITWYGDADLETENRSCDNLAQGIFSLGAALVVMVARIIT